MIPTACVQSISARDLPECFLPEEGDRTLFKRAVLDFVIGDIGEAIKRCLVAAGFTVVCVSKIIHQPVYEIRLRRPRVSIGDTDVRTRFRIRQAFKRAGLYRNSRSNLLVISVQPRQIICGFQAAEEVRRNYKP